MSNSDFLEANRELWDAWTEVNADSEFYDVEAFRSGATTLKPIELEELGDVEGKTLLHLQCHFGLDTLSWARRGARVTGVDLSPRAIDLARSMAADLDLPARFECSNLYDLPRVLNEPFDIVFTSYGVIEWLPDLTEWARLIASCLRPGGIFYMVEFHPVAVTADDDGKLFHYPYFSSPDPIRTVENGSYANRDAATKHVSYVWPHTLGEIVSALATAGLRIEFLHEHSYSPYDCFLFTEELQPGKAMIPGLEEKVPLVFSLKATRGAQERTGHHPAPNAL